MRARWYEKIRKSINAVPLIGMFGFAPPLQPALQLWCGTGGGVRVVDRHQILSLHPVCISVRLKKLYKGFHGYFNHVFTTSTLQGRKKRLSLSLTLFTFQCTVHCKLFRAAQSHLTDFSSEMIDAQFQKNIVVKSTCVATFP